MIEIYTDGSCKKNGDGGWAFTLYDKENEIEYSQWGHVKETTNNRMEMMAVIKALQSIEKDIETERKVLQSDEKYDNITIYTDSRYVIGGASLGWKQKKNHDLWTELLAEVVRLKPEFVWVRGHNGDPRNEEVNDLAQEASGVR